MTAATMSRAGPRGNTRSVSPTTPIAPTAVASHDSGCEVTVRDNRETMVRLRL